MLSSEIIPRLSKNAQQLEALFAAIDHMHEIVLPQVEGSVARMGEALGALQVLRAEHFMPRNAAVGSFGLGSPWGAQVGRAWTKAMNDETGSPKIPEVFSTADAFSVKEGMFPL
ncbi:unnamed protein product [Choristocarpus tenellus]